MKKSSKKILSLLLAVVMILTLALPSFAQGAQAAAADLPIIYLPGRNDKLYQKQEDGSLKMIYPVVEDEVQYTKDASVKIAKALAKAMALEPVMGKKAWDDYCDEVVDLVAYGFTTIQLDENGNPKDNTCDTWNAEKSYVNPKKSGYNQDDYTVRYDWRLDPCDVAKDLNTYIERVKEATGHDQVKILAHCEGCAIAQAYLKEYASKDDYKGVYSLVMSCPTTTSDTVGAIWSNKIVFDSNAIADYATSYLNSTQNRFFDEDPATVEMLTAVINILNQCQVLGIGTDTIDKIYLKIKDNLVPRLIKSTFFFPSYFAMIPDEYFEDSMNLLFAGEFGEQYKGYREKVEYYHNNIQVKSDEILLDAKENGVNISVMCKYGFNMLPISKNCRQVADGRIETSTASLGATTSKVSGKLSNSYLEKADPKYISPDKQIDASTCLFPDSTWFLRNATHAGLSYPELITFLLNAEGQPTVNDNPTFTQFLSADKDGNFAPAQGDTNLAKYWVNDMLTALFRFVRACIDMLTKLIKNA